MPTIAVLIKVEEGRIAAALHEWVMRMDSVGGGIVVDFSSVSRIDPSGLRAIDEFAKLADANGVKVSVRGMNVDVYRVLKLADLAQRWSFASWHSATTKQES
jgi:anti-anti-sigma regulatory factor